MDCWKHNCARGVNVHRNGMDSCAQAWGYAAPTKPTNAIGKTTPALSRPSHAITNKFQVRLAVILLALLSSSSLAYAQDRSNGELIANTQCSRCHVIIGTSPKDGRFGPVPSFSEVANAPSTTQTSLREFLSMPHAWMPNYRLTRNEILDITDYILSLKS